MGCFSRSFRDGEVEVHVSPASVIIAVNCGCGRQVMIGAGSYDLLLGLIIVIAVSARPVGHVC